MDVLKSSSISINAVGGVLTFYFVMTSLFTVRRPQVFPWIDRAGVLFALTAAVLALKCGFELLSRHAESHNV